MTRRGMTLVELLAALAVTALAGAVGASTLTLLADRRASLRIAGTEVARAAAVRRTIVAWLRGAHGPLSPLSGATPATFQLLDQQRRGHSADELLFTTTAATPSGNGETTVRLYVDEDDRTPERGLVAEISTFPGDAGARIELDSTVAELEVRCMTELAGTRQWVPSFLSLQAVPRGIELRLRPRAGAELHPLLRLPIRAVLEAGR